jgi:hypothetical protein
LVVSSVFHTDLDGIPPAQPLEIAPMLASEEARVPPASAEIIPTQLPAAPIEPSEPTRGQDSLLRPPSELPTAVIAPETAPHSPIIVATAVELAPTSTPRPTQRPPTPTATPAANNPFFKLLDPLLAQAQVERKSARANDPNYGSRIDAQLNDGRINFLAMGHGITYEPPWPPDRMGSISVFSVNLKKGVIHQITINHDVRAPEIERFLQAQNPDAPKQAHKIDKAVFIGGHNLLRRTVENATGLHIDYVVTFNDVILKHLVDLLDGINVTNPYPFKSNPCFVIPGTEIPGLEITGKRQRLNGDQAVCYLKGIEIIGKDEKYSKTRENAYRIPVLRRGLSERFNERFFQDPLLTVKLTLWLKDSLDRKEILTNLDVMNTVPAMLSRITPADIANGFSIPPSGATVYLVYDHSGDGGLMWVDTDKSEITRKDIAAGVYTRGGHYDSTFAVAAGGNPYAVSLVEGYWNRCREIVKTKLR